MCTSFITKGKYSERFHSALTDPDQFHPYTLNITEHKTSLLLNYLKCKTAQSVFFICTGHQTSIKLGKKLSLHYLHIEQQLKISLDEETGMKQKNILVQDTP